MVCLSVCLTVCPICYLLPLLQQDSVSERLPSPTLELLPCFVSDKKMDLLPIQSSGLTYVAGSGRGENLNWVMETKNAKNNCPE